MNLVKAIGTIGGLTMVSRVLGFVRDMIGSRVLGASHANDAFNLAFFLPNVFRRLFGEGAFAAYAGAARGERKREQELLLGFLLKGTAADGAAKGATGSLFTSELLTILSEERAASGSASPAPAPR